MAVRKLPEATTPCLECKLPMPQGARLCSECGSYQDRRRWLSISSTVLALVTALISVSALALPTLLKAFHTPKSVATLDLPTFDGTTFRVVATNSGDAPASVAAAAIDSNVLAPATKIKLRSDNAAFVQPGSQQLTFDIVPLLSGDQAYGDSLVALSNAIQRKRELAGVVHVRLVQSDGEYTSYSFPMGQAALFYLLRAHSDHCQSIKTPDFENGCVGPGQVK
jgi:hypothetical protein